jgi:hypothetical protein
VSIDRSLFDVKLLFKKTRVEESLALGSDQICVPQCGAQRRIFDTGKKGPRNNPEIDRAGGTLNRSSGAK